MKAKLDRRDVLRALATAAAIADRKSTMPILAMTLLRVEKGAISISATDLGTSSTATIKCEVSAPGAIAVEARRLYDVIKGLPVDAFTLEKSDDAQIEIRSGRSVFRIHALPAKDFPKMAAAPTEMRPFDAAIFCEMAAAVFPSICLDDSRIHLGAALFESKGGEARMVSTDGHRLSIATRKADGVESMIIPRVGLDYVRKAIEGATAANMGTAHGQLFIEIGDMVISTKLAETNLPPFEQVIPRDYARKVKVNREAFAACIGRVGKMLPSTDKSPACKMIFADGEIVISAEHTDTGSAEDAIECEYDGERFIIGCGIRYLTEGLASLMGTTVSVNTNKELDPIGVYDETGSFVVVMPMRL